MRKIINLYDKNETNFEHNGLVVLSDCKYCFITEEINGNYSLELEYPKDERGKYKYLQGWNIIKADGQLFRIPQLSKSQDDVINIRLTANHIFYDLVNDFNEDTRAEGKSVDEALVIALATNPKFTVLSSDLLNINTAYFIRENPVTSIFQKIMPRWGGELYRDNFNITIKSRVGEDTGILISYGKNIKGFEQTLDYSTIATRIMPVGKNGLTIDLVNQGSKYLESPRINEYPFIITKIVEFNDIEDATELKNKVISLWGTIDVPSVNYKVNFIELSKTEEYKHLKTLREVSLGDTVTIRHKEFEVDISARVIKTKKNVLTERLEEIEIGQFRENITGYINSLDGKIDYANEVIAEVNEDLQGTKTTVFQNNQAIILKAQELQGNIDNTNEDLGNIDTRLSDAEIKITPTAIVNTVRQSTQYTGDIANINTAIQAAQSTAESNANLYSDDKLNAFVTTIYNSKVTDLQNQIDGNITTWFYDGVPTIDNYPTTSWSSTVDKDKHLGDLYYDNLKGYAYRFTKVGDTYSWNIITDTDVTKALGDASKAQDTADSKRRVFVNQPIPPYDIGDLWTQGVDGDLMNCKLSKTEVQAYSDSDWEKASKYTDDAKANEVAGNLATANGKLDELTNRVTNSEEKITPEAITQTVTQSNTYKSYNLVPNKSTISTTRASLIINPLDTFNFVSGTTFNNNELVNIDMGIDNLVYTADLQIANNELVTFDKPADRITTAEGQIAVQAGKISLVVKEDGTVDGQSLIAAINISPIKIEQTALNIDFTGYATFISLSTPGATEIDGGNFKTHSVGAASIKTDELIVGDNITMGSNAYIAWSNVTGQPFIPGSASDVGAIPSTYIDANGVFTPQVYATNINVSGGKITATQIDVATLQTQITAVSQFIYFTGNPINGIGNMTGGSYINYLGMVSNYGIYLNAPDVKTQDGTVATQEWVTANVGSSTATFG